MTESRFKPDPESSRRARSRSNVDAPTPNGLGTIAEELRRTIQQTPLEDEITERLELPSKEQPVDNEHEPTIDLEYTAVAHGDKTGAIQIERGHNNAPGALEMGISDIAYPSENIPDLPPTPKKTHQQELVDITNQNITTIQTKLREGGKMSLGIREIYEQTLQNNLQKLETLVGKEPKKTAAKDRGLTIKNFDKELHQETPEDRIAMEARSKETFNKPAAMTDHELTDWQKRTTQKTKTGQYQESVKIEQYRTRRNKQLAEGIGKEDASWFDDDNRETYLNHTKPERKAKPTLFKRFTNFFKF